MKARTQWVAVLATVVGFGVAPAAKAEWTFGGVSGGAATTTGYVDGQGSGITLGITGAAAANGGTLTGGALGTAITPGATYGITGFASAATTWAVNSASTLQFYSGGGLGMASDSTLGTAPNHAMDNGPATNSSDLISGLGNTESVMLSFSSSVVLSSIGIGYKSGDADISLFRWVGSSSGPTLNGTNATTMTGWELVGNYGDLATDTSNPYNNVNGCSGTTLATVACSASSKGSSWWLISAYNSTYGAATSGAVDQGNDFFKVYAVAGSAGACIVGGKVCGSSTGTAAEPASLALVALGLFGAMSTRRRRTPKAEA